MTECQIQCDSAGPGEWRGGVGVLKGSKMLQSEDTVISYICDRERAIVWGIEGGLPSIPHGLTLKRAGHEETVRLGTIFSDVALKEGDHFWRPTGGGGGFGDPLKRDPAHVLEDVVDDYVSVERAARDYGVVIRAIDAELCEYEIDHDRHDGAARRDRARAHGWARADPETVARRFREGEIDMLDVNPPPRRDPPLGARASFCPNPPASSARASSALRRQMGPATGRREMPDPGGSRSPRPPFPQPQGSMP